MDSFIFQAMAVELNNRIANSRLDKVIQPSSGTMILKLWTGKEKVQLLLKAEGEGAYHLTEKNFPAPAKPPRFCQLLRAKLRRLVEVRAEPLDRIVHFMFSGPDNKSYDLVLEALGKQGNLILIDQQEKIVDLLFRREGKRSMLPGEIYRLPEQTLRMSLFDDIDKVAAVMRAHEVAGETSFPSIAPMSPVLSKAVLLARQSGQTYEAILMRVNTAFETGDFIARKVSAEGFAGMMPVPFKDNDICAEEFKDLSTLVEQGFDDETTLTMRDLAARMRSIIKKQYKYLEKRKEKIAAERKRQADPEKFKVFGELLLANLHQFRRGDNSVVVEDYYQSPPVTISIELDSKLTPSENAERYFKKYRKAKRSGEHHVRRLQETKQELQWLEQVELALDEAETGEELYQVQTELEEAGLFKNTKGQLAKRQMTRPEDQLYKTTTPAGWQLYWGKNSRTNDYVSKTMTAVNDYWFHARGMPGAHLVLKCGENADKVAEDDILFAAAIAAGYSKGKDDGKVEVIVARGKDVRKPKGAKPGLVTVDSYRSVLVVPMRLDN